MNADFFKRGLLLFWAVWFSVVLATNACDALREIGLLGPGWRFASGNFRAVAETTARYDTPGWLNGLLFAGVIAWEAAATVLFWLAWRESRGPQAKANCLYPAFSVGLLLFGAFLIADELLMAYPVEATHLRLFTAQLASLLAIVLLPGREPAAKIESRPDAVSPR